MLEKERKGKERRTDYHRVLRRAVRAFRDGDGEARGWTRRASSFCRCFDRGKDTLEDGTGDKSVTDIQYRDSKLTGGFGLGVDGAFSTGLAPPAFGRLKPPRLAMRLLGAPRIDLDE